MRTIGIGASVWAMLVAGCIGGGSSDAGGSTSTTQTPQTPQAPTPPVKRGDWTWWGRAQGLSDDVQDVSADEGGNVYVAGGDALFVKRAGDQAFLRFDAAGAGLTKGCNDPADYHDETPAKPFTMCRILAVAGASAGKAIIGFDGFNLEPQDGAAWTFKTGGADVVTFDPAAKTLARQRHVRIASPPHVICATTTFYGRVSSCPDPTNWWWVNGRRMVARVRRIVVNHDPRSPMYGDVWFGGKHGTFSALLANAEARRLPDHTAGFLPEWADAKDVWEHDHPDLWDAKGGFVNGEGWALSIDPRDGTVWGSNGYRTTTMQGYGADLSDDHWWTGTKHDLWPDPPGEYLTPAADDVQSMSHCPDGTLWIGSLSHGLARFDPAGQLSFTSLPDPALRESVSAVACDPADSSLWIGLGVGGVMRLRNGKFEAVDTTGLPFASNRVQSIQIDRWSPTRIVYFAFAPLTDGNGAIVQGGGVGAYAGP
jgi:hypothetical protein